MNCRDTADRPLQRHCRGRLCRRASEPGEPGSRDTGEHPLQHHLDVGYARVSTGHRLLAGQHDALAESGCERIFTDQLSGVREDRPGLVELLGYVRAGDTMVVVALDRLGRSLSGVVRTVETLTERGVLLRSLREGIDYSTPTGRTLAGIFAALAGYERELMHERAAAARARGRHTGRPPRLSPGTIVSCGVKRGS